MALQGVDSRVRVRGNNYLNNEMVFLASVLGFSLNSVNTSKTATSVSLKTFIKIFFLFVDLAGSD